MKTVAKNKKSKAGRKPLPDELRRQKICVRVKPETLTILEKLSTNIGAAIDMAADKANLLL